MAECWAGINDVSWLPEPKDNAVVGNVGPEDNGEGTAVRNFVADSLRPVPNAHYMWVLGTVASLYITF